MRAQRCKAALTTPTPLNSMPAMEPDDAILSTENSRLMARRNLIDPTPMTDLERYMRLSKRDRKSFRQSKMGNNGDCRMLKIKLYRVYPRSGSTAMDASRLP